MPGRVPPDKLLMERRMKDEQAAAAEELARLAKMQDMRNDWEKSTDRKLQANAVRYRMQRLLRDTEVTLEARRQR
jgi:cilia- and flagella-associated protein 53